MTEFKSILDVRTIEEFKSGHIKGSVNIPMQEITARMDEVKELSQPILLCCQSGARSGQVAGYLKAQGIECENGGGWEEIKDLLDD